MKLIIELTGAEQTAEVERVLASVAAFYGTKQSTRDYLREGQTVTTAAPVAPQSVDPLAMFAPSTADVSASQTAPAVVPAGVPLPPPVASSPALPPASAPAAATASTGLALDASGLYWDGRIHSESKAKLTNGNWRQRRNTPPDVLARVEAEIRQTLAAGGGAPLVVSTPVAPPAPIVTPPAPPIETAAASTATPTPPAVPGGLTPEAPEFSAFMKRFLAATQQGRVTQSDMAQGLAAIGIPTVLGLRARADLIPSLEAFLPELKVPA